MRATRQIFIPILLLFANFSVLLHSAIPHVHHDGIVCMASKGMKLVIPSSDCDNDTCCWNNLTQNKEKHNHLMICDAFLLLQRNQTSLINEIFQIINQQFDSHTELMFQHISCFCFSALSLEKKPIKPYLSTYINPYIGNALNLRAPPANILV